jgi:predicted MPP superfamily phosphohydrolase
MALEGVLLMKLKKLIKYFVFLIIAVLFLYYQNNSIVVSNINLEFDKLSQGLEGLRLVQISDLHNKEFGKNQNRLAAKIKKADPELILITGDIIDSKKYDEKPALELIDEISKIAPVYYVTGNHEFLSGKFNSLEKKLQERGVRILRDSGESIERGRDSLEIIGVDDPALKLDTQYQYQGESKILLEKLQKALEGSEEGSFKILLSHRPELVSVYAEKNIDLTFTGHAHGGQFRFPFVGGIIAPNQGLLPKYTSGSYKEGNSVMIVNRGLGNSIIPQRIFNRPEIIAVKLNKR